MSGTEKHEPSQSSASIEEDAAERFGTSGARFFNRELSWLAFNTRVLEEASNIRHPLLERVRFLSISASNLDEFYMVRVAGLMDQLQHSATQRSQDGRTPAEQLLLINETAGRLMQEQQRSWQELQMLLDAQGITVLKDSELREEDMPWLENYFLENIFPVLTPIAIDPAHPFPFLPNQSLTAVYELQHIRRGKQQLAVIPFPHKLERFVRIPGEGWRFVRMETLLRRFLEHLFPGYEMIEEGFVHLLRDSDLDAVDEAEDLMRGYEKAVKERRRGGVVRMKVNARMPEHLRRFVFEHLRVSPQDSVEVEGWLDLGSLAELVKMDRPDLLYTPYNPRFPERITDFGGDCFAAIHNKDIVIHHPYESFDVVVQFLRQAARDEDVISIKQTLYRTSANSPIVKALIEAAEAGKSVTAVVELRARFDEEANIKWSRDLERVGVHVVYGVVSLKTHAKISLVTKKMDGKMVSFVHFGTGNYHPITAKAYTDLSFFTSHPDYCRDAAAMFNYLTGYATPRAFRKLVMAPTGLRKTLLRLIDEEIAHAREGRPAYIWAKLNALVDKEIIDALYRASQEGVKIVLVVRGICCLRPGIKGFSDNIRVKSLIGRFLEHSRIFCFGSGHKLPSAEAKVYISSADWMPRNMDRRVETMVPLENPTVHAQVLGQIMVANLQDDLQSWELGSDGVYTRMKPEGEGFSAHDYFMHNPSLSGRGKALKKSKKGPPKLYALNGKGNKDKHSGDKK